MPIDAKILVTGANNIVAQAIIDKLLVQGKKIRAISNKKQEFKADKNLEFQKCSLFNISELADAMEGIEKIYHCDEFVSFLPKEEDKLYNINVIGTENLVNIALSKNVQKLVYLSSTLAFGTYQHKSKINEETRRTEHKKNTYYTICKSRAELEISRGNAEGLETIIVCPSIIIQQKNKDSIYNIVNIAKANYSSYPEGKNGFVGLKDVVAATTQLMESEKNNEKYIVSAENRTYQSILEHINPNLKQKHLFSKMNNTKAKIIGKINKFRNFVFDAAPFLTPEILNFDGKEFIFENEKIIKALDFEFTSINKVLEEIK